MSLATASLFIFFVLFFIMLDSTVEVDLFYYATFIYLGEAYPALVVNISQSYFKLTDCVIISQAIIEVITTLGCGLNIIIKLIPRIGIVTKKQTYIS